MIFDDFYTFITVYKFYNLGSLQYLQKNDYRPDINNLLTGTIRIRPDNKISYTTHAYF